MRVNVLLSNLAILTLIVLLAILVLPEYASPLAPLQPIALLGPLAKMVSVLLVPLAPLMPIAPLDLLARMEHVYLDNNVLLRNLVPLARYAQLRVNALLHLPCANRIQIVLPGFIAVVALVSLAVSTRTVRKDKYVFLMYVWLAELALVIAIVRMDNRALVAHARGNLVLLMLRVPRGKYVLIRDNVWLPPRKCVLHKIPVVLVPIQVTIAIKAPAIHHVLLVLLMLAPRIITVFLLLVLPGNLAPLAYVWEVVLALPIALVVRSVLTVIVLPARLYPMAPILYNIMGNILQHILPMELILICNLPLRRMLQEIVNGITLKNKVEGILKRRD